MNGFARGASSCAGMKNEAYPTHGDQAAAIGQGEAGGGMHFLLVRLK